MKTKEILKWADDRNLLDINNCYKQYSKLQEESNELLVAMLDDNSKEVEDAIGDIGIVMIIISEQLGYDFEKCIDKAYEVIKNRTGKTENGTFIKD